MKILLTLLTVLFFLPLLTGQETSPEFDPAYAQKLRLKLANIGAVYDLEGLSAAVLVPGQGIWVGTWGKANATDQVTPDMRFGIASNSKAVVAALMLKLQEEGLVDLDDPLMAYLPTYQHINPNITIRQLLTHTSGLFDFLNDWTTETSNAYANNPDSIWTFEDLIKTIGPPHELPGKRYRYSNTNFLLAGMIAEAVTNLPIREVLQSRIFDPLDLNMIYPVGANVFSSPYSNVFSGSTPILEPGFEDTFLSFTATAGAIWSSAYDMVRWYDALFGQQWLSPESQFELRNNDGYNPYGMGIRLANRYGTSYYHHGGVWGFRSYMIHDAHAGISVCLLSNKFGFSVSAAARSFFQEVLNEHPQKDHDLVVNGLSPAGTMCDFQNSFQLDVTNAGTNQIGNLRVIGTLDQNSSDSVDINLLVPIDAGQSAMIDFPFDVQTINGQKQRLDVEVKHGQPDGYSRDNRRTSVFRLQESPGQSLPFEEDFENTFGVPASLMTYNHQDIFDWKITEFAGQNSKHSFVRNNYSDGNLGKRFSFDLPMLNMERTPSSLSFAYAYASYSGTEEDGLRIYASTDCGLTFQLIADLTGPDYPTAPATTAYFLPTANQWKEISLDLAEFNDQSVIFRFEVENEFGNHLYVDNIRIDFVTSTQSFSNSSMKIIPNPSRGDVTVQFSAQIANAQLALFNQLGVQVFNQVVNRASSKLVIPRGNLPAGLYTVVIHSGEHTLSDQRIFFLD